MTRPTLADRVLSMAWLFDKGDTRKDDVRRLAAEIEADLVKLTAERDLAQGAVLELGRAANRLVAERDAARELVRAVRGREALDVVLARVERAVAGWDREKEGAR